MIYVVYDHATGSIAYAQTHDGEWSPVLPEGQSSAEFDDGDTSAQDALSNVTKYTVQNGQLTLVPPPSDTELLAQAKQTKKAELYQAWQNACLTFQSSALGSPHTYTNDVNAIGRYNAIMNRILKDSTYVPPAIYTHEAGYVAHTAAQFTQVFDDGMADEQTKAQNYEQKCVDEDNATTVDAVNAINW